jgi:hypothetical protein
MKSFFFCLVLLMSLPAFTQEDSPVRPEDLEQRVHVIGGSRQLESPQENPSQNPTIEQAPAEAAPVATGNEDEDLIHNLEAERRKSVETALKLEQAKNNITEAAFNAPEELKKLGYNTITATALMDEKVVKVVKKMMEQSTLKNATNEEVRTLILDKAKGSFMEGYLKKHPKVTDTFVEILRDEKAMSSLVGIFLRRGDLKLYAGFWFGLMILAWLLKKMFFKKNWTPGKRFGMGLLVSVCVTTTSLTIFYNMFSNEISPMAKIVIKNWRRRNL